MAPFTKAANRAIPARTITAASREGIFSFSNYRRAVTWRRPVPSRAALTGLRCYCSRRKTIFDADIAALRPTELLEPLPESREARLRFRIVLRSGHQHAYSSHAVALLSMRN